MLGITREKSHLAPQALVHLDIAIRAIERLLQKSKQHRHNDDGLERLAEDDEKDWHCKYIDSHGEGDGSCPLG